jgi:hypothetical protein
MEARYEISERSPRGRTRFFPYRAYSEEESNGNDPSRNELTATNFFIECYNKYIGPSTIIISSYLIDKARNLLQNTEKVVLPMLNFEHVFYKNGDLLVIDSYRITKHDKKLIQTKVEANSRSKS